MVPLAVFGTLAARRAGAGVFAAEAVQDRLRTVGGVSLSLAGGFLLSMWSLRATWALFL